MRYWLRGFRGGLLAFSLIVALVIGGLSWLTLEALRLETERQEARVQEAVSGQLQFVLSLMDSRVRRMLAREENRPYHHYSAVYAPPLVFNNDGSPTPPGVVVEPSPLMGEVLPEWMLLHFQVSVKGGWSSPHVLSRSMRERFSNAQLEQLLINVTPEKSRLLCQLQEAVAPAMLASLAEQFGTQPSLYDTILVQNNLNPGDNPSQAMSQNPNLSQNSQLNPQMPYQEGGRGGQFIDQNYLRRLGAGFRASQDNKNAVQRDDLEQARLNTLGNGEPWFLLNKKQLPSSEPIEVVLSPMTPLWLDTTPDQERLLLLRLVRIADQRVCQGIVLDWQRLKTVLAAEVTDQFPEARLLPATPGEAPGPGVGAMTDLPVLLDPGPEAFKAPAAGWTALRVGLTLAWAAALVAMMAVGLGGWSLIDLSERRIRFVSAVTHELRTPLTTLRLYLDMLTGGMVREEHQKEDYLKTLQTEAERLHRLVGNVLDYARLENNRPRLAKRTVKVAEVLDQVRTTWQDRSRTAGKELVVEEGAIGLEVETDPELVQQIVGNLIDNACKYTQGAEDGHIWVRSLVEGNRLVFEVEDRGPGVPVREWRAIFQPFRRGRSVETTAGGVGLGLALARRWAALLGGGLTLSPCGEKPGACFRLELPLAA